MSKKILFSISFVLLTLPAIISQADTNKEVLKVADQMPKFSDCENESETDGVDCSTLELFQFIGEHLKYPEVAIANGTEGKVYVQFVVQEDGSLSDINVVRDIGDGCGDATRDLLLYMSDNHAWIPGLQDGEAVNVLMTLPILFQQNAAESEKVEKKHKVIDTMPRFPGCEHIKDESKRKACSDQKLLRYIYSNLKMPKEAKKAKIDDQVYVQFILKADGKLSEIEVIRSIGFGCDEEALRVVKKMQEEITWIPGYSEGKAVDVKFTLPLSFKNKRK